MWHIWQDAHWWAHPANIRTRLPLPVAFGAPYHRPGNHLLPLLRHLHSQAPHHFLAAWACLLHTGSKVLYSAADVHGQQEPFEVSRARRHARWSCSFCVCSIRHCLCLCQLCFDIVQALLTMQGQYASRARKAQALLSFSFYSVESDSEG
jgi:hypothetical protein